MRAWRGSEKAAPGETNHLTVRHGRWGLIFHDPGSHVRARGDCRVIDRHTATCLASEEGPSVRLGDGNDRVELGRVINAMAHGGGGDDRLTGGDEPALYGGPGDDVVSGGPGFDVLSGGAGRDRLQGGRGDDLLLDDETDAQERATSSTAGRDRDGDEIQFQRRRQSVRIDLRRGTTDTGDAIADVEDVYGGSGDDRLTGNGEANFLGGGAGADVVRGAGGDDNVRGGPGNRPRIRRLWA